MTDYTKTTDFTAKDALTTGDPLKVVSGSEIDDEFSNIATSSATKANKVVSGTTNGILIQTASGDLADGSKTLPSGGVVGTTDTQTLTNKTLTSPVLATPQVNDTSADHQYIFGVSELAADRTVTLPLLTGNDEFVFKDHTQTLTNKTLTSPAIDLSTVTSSGDLSVADGGTGASTLTQYGILIGAGTGAVQVTSAGTTGQVLVATTGSNPAFGQVPTAGIEDNAVTGAKMQDFVAPITVGEATMSGISGEKYTQSTGYTKVCEVQCHRGGTVTVVIDGMVTAGTGSYQLWIDGVYYSGTWTTTSTSFVEVVSTNVAITPGQKLQAYIKSSNAAWYAHAKLKVYAADENGFEVTL